jgi:hypothetical protein
MQSYFFHNFLLVFQNRPNKFSSVCYFKMNPTGKDWTASEFDLSRNVLYVHVPDVVHQHLIGRQLELGGRLAVVHLQTKVRYLDKYR